MTYILQGHQMCSRLFFPTFLLIFCLILSACGGGGGSKDNGADSGSSSDTELPSKLELFGGLAPRNTDSSSIEYYYNISLQKLDDQQYIGTSMIRPVNSTDELAILNVEALFDGVNLMLEEVSLVNIDNASGMNEEFYNCLRSSSLTVNDGETSGQWTSTSGCISGKMYLSTVSPATFDGLPDCPCKFDEDLKDEGDGTWSANFNSNWFHPGASKEMRWTPLNGGPGQQCTYDAEGNLITGGLAAGTPDKHSPSSNILGHTAHDVAPLFAYSCKQYFSVFPPNNGKKCGANIITPLIEGATTRCDGIINQEQLKAWAWGDPHLTTFDGVAYDMQAVGEFVFVRSVEDDFEIQIRTHPWRNLTTAAIISAVATRMSSGDTILI